MKRAYTEYSLKFAACRDLGHAWFYQSWNGRERTVICSNCGTRRVDTLNEYRVERRRYRYIQGYHITDVNRFEAAIELRRLLQRLAKRDDIRWQAEAARRGVE